MSLLTEDQPDPLTWPHFAAHAPDRLRRLDADALAWLRLALRHTAHGMDLRIGGSMGAEDDALQCFRAAGWLRPLHFAPDASQRAWALVGTRNPGGKADDLVRAHKGRSHSAYWWGPGEQAAAGLALLPPERGITPGDVVRYAPEFLRSIGMSSDREMSGWRGVVLRVREHARGFRLVDCEVPLGPCGCSVPRPDPECDRCEGTGQTAIARVNVKNLRRTTENAW